MRPIKSTTPTPDYFTLPTKEVTFVHSETHETIQVHVDKENSKIYLGDHLKSLFPFPSMGMEMKDMDIAWITHLEPNKEEELEFIYHPTAYKYLIPYIKEDGLLDIDLLLFNVLTDQHEEH